MSVVLIPFGEPYQDVNSDYLTVGNARRTLSACIQNGSFEVLELRRWEHDDGSVADVIVVDCVNDQVPSRNDVGIKVRERLALVFHQNKNPEVRALRQTFPKVPHLNQVPSTEPKSFCLYFQTWSAVERTWTPQKYLQRIIWWLAETAKKSLHLDDQPLENVYFDSPFEIVLPPDFDEKIKDPNLDLTFSAVKMDEHNFRIIRGIFVSKQETNKHDLSKIELFDIELPAIVHGSIDALPCTLGELNDHYQSRGAPYYENLVRLIKEKAAGGVNQDSAQRCLIILRAPLLRVEGGEPESNEIRAFLTVLDLVALGMATGALFQNPADKKYYAECKLGVASDCVQNEWMAQSFLPVELRLEVSRSRAREFSGVSSEGSNIRCTLLGVGALGGAIAELASKSGWANWTFIDPDFIKAHNTVRHVSDNRYIGWYKAEAVRTIVEANYHSGCYSAVAINDSAVNYANEKVMAALTSSALNIDATTTLEVPRDISQLDEVSRSVSVFITPSGRDVVMLIEDDGRTIRLDALEPQYYRAIINSDWGGNHLAGNRGNLWVGAGCRDVSAVISYESVQLAAATLSKQIRMHQGRSEAGIKVWLGDETNSSLTLQEVSVCPVRKVTYDNWVVVLDGHIEQQLKSMRQEHLPRETGGIIIGYIDQKLSTIYIVDVLPAPYDSQADYSGFIRGVAGLDDVLTEIANRTGNIVGYLGEWHSHPEFSSATPSSMDWKLISKLSDLLAVDAQPALMLIVGIDGELSITVGSQL